MNRLRAMLVLVLSATSLIAATAPSTPAKFGTASISGTITDSATGFTIAGAKVTAGSCGRSATTADDGTYTIGNLAAGTYAVKAMKCGAYVMKQYPTPVVLSEGQQVTGIDIALAPMGGGGGTGSISGTVYDGNTNEPIAGARVVAGCCGNSALTADDGTYTIEGLADGSYAVKAMKEGYECASYPTPVVIENGGAVEGIDFQLVPSRRTTRKGLAY